MSLKGSPQLRARLKALALTFKPLGKDWADEAASIGRQHVPNRNTKYSTGELHDSIRRKNATQKKATVVGRYTGYFVDHGVKAHSLQRRKSRPKGRTIFQSRKQHPGYRARPFRALMAREALRRHPMAAAVIRQWNSAR